MKRITAYLKGKMEDIKCMSREKELIQHWKWQD